MAQKSVLWHTSSFGLGHLFRDIAIVRELRAMVPHLRISWICSSPVSDVLTSLGEAVLPESNTLFNPNDILERSSGGYGLNILKTLMGTGPGFQHNLGVLLDAHRKYRFDLWVGDESWELYFGLARRPELKKSPFVFLTDFLKFSATSLNLREHLLSSYLNRSFCRSGELSRRPVADLQLLLVEEEDLPRGRWGIFLPRVREWARRNYRIVGPVLHFDPVALPPPLELRRALGYSQTSVLIVAAVGGTGVGGDLLRACVQAHSLLRKRTPELETSLICGPRIDGSNFNGDGLIVKGYVPDLYLHYGACDVAVVQGGYASCLELTALNKPFLFLPLAGHFEQERYVTRFLQRHGAGIRLSPGDLKPGPLADRIATCLKWRPRYRPVRPDGSKKAAKLISTLLV